MSREEYIRGSMALVMAELFPPLVRDAVLADVAFAANLALASDATVTFKPADVSFKRSVLFGGCSGIKTSRTVAGRYGRSWTDLDIEI